MRSRLLWLTACIGMLLCIVSPTKAQEVNPGNKSAHSGMTRETRVDQGSMNGRSYHSDYFNFTYSMPDAFEEGTEQYKQGILQQTGLRQDAYTFILFHADRQPTPNGEPTGGITIMADILSGYPKGATEKDYLHHVVSRAMTRKGDDMLEEGDEVHVSSHSFFRADYRANGHPLNGYETVMLTFQRGFALSWSFSAPSKEEVESAVSSMTRTLFAK